MQTRQSQIFTEEEMAAETLQPQTPQLEGGQSLPAGLRGKAAPTSYSRGPRKGVGDQGGPASILQGEARRARG